MAPEIPSIEGEGGVGDGEKVEQANSAGEEEDYDTTDPANPNVRL